VSLIGIALIGLLYGISTLFTGNRGIAVCSCVAGLICLILFIKRQRILPEPLIDLRPLGVAPFATGVAINMISLIVIFSMNIIMPIFMQSNMGASSMKASLTLFPAIVLCCIVAPIAGRIYDRFGAKYLLPSGFALICIFTLLIALFRGNSSLLLFAILYIPVICGSALIIGPVQSYALSFLSPELNPHGVTVMSTGFQIAGCIGSSVFTGIYASALGARLSSGIDPAAAAESGFLFTVLAASLCALAGFVLSVSLNRFKRPQTHEAQVYANELQQIMKTDIYSIDADSTLLETLTYITEKKISGVPVTENGKLVGFISDGDILRYLSGLHPLFESAWSLAAAASQEHGFDRRLSDLISMKVRDIAVKRVITVNSGDSLREVCRVLEQNHLKKVPVMDGPEMVGIINSSNITKYALQKVLSNA
ncbi:MAG: MFS transporter, partial [Firmicutes bacterium]|nr:MFS transporter [Bacillota bacterium]